MDDDTKISLKWSYRSSRPEGVDTDFFLGLPGETHWWSREDSREDKRGRKKSRPLLKLDGHEMLGWIGGGAATTVAAVATYLVTYLQARRVKISLSWKDRVISYEGPGFGRSPEELAKDLRGLLADNELAELAVEAIYPSKRRGRSSASGPRSEAR